MSSENLKKTPLNAVHRALGGKMVDFGGWDMPVQYPAGVIEEHMATRTRAGLFDVSHMGEIWVEGPDAIPFVNSITTNDVTKLVDGQAHYSAFPNLNGGVVDDLLVYRFAEERLLLVVNAGTTEKDWDWIQKYLPGGDASVNERAVDPPESTLPNGRVSARNASAEYCQIAIQGLKAIGILQQLTDTELEPIKYYHFTEGKVDGVDAIISRTGYTGEDGFEVYAAADKAEQLWNKMLETGASEGILPCGLAARNTLRLESGMSLYGHELGDDISTLEAGLGWITKLQKGEFVGREQIASLKEAGLKRKLVGFEMKEPGIARDGFDIYHSDEKVGVVTSGSPAPFLKKNIGLAFVPPELANVGQEIRIDVRGKRLAAEVVPTPFYKREK
ncbi:MAG TPA: glycine cleavage system aminomethyltransferase GcvT [Pyrinomonadaceae bacterium]|nr:glycine cleavage system aminomethyltransferase GcvT [Pyrinomonadaceae bacterium]